MADAEARTRMCTLIVIREEEALRVAANRDEELDRPARPPELWRLGARTALAPVDERARGTWIGVNDAGLFAALTNRFGASGRPDAPSRGRWVPRMLEGTSADEAVARLRRESVPENGFHLVVADLGAAFLAVHDGSTLEVSPLPLGATVVTERSFGAAEAPREARIRRALAERGSGRDALASVLELEDPEAPLDGVRVFSSARGYGTRSSSLVELGPGGLRFAFAERYPRERPYEEVGGLLASGSTPPTSRR